jgi:hypothetical protein
MFNSFGGGYNAFDDIFYKRDSLTISEDNEAKTFILCWCHTKVKVSLIS